MFTDNVKQRGRGRPAGPTPQSVETRQRLYDTALRLIAERSYAATTMRDIAGAAGVSVGLLYRYFPTKHAVLLALYDDLSTDFARAAASLPDGRWRDRAIAALRASLQTLGPHRVALQGLTPVLVGDPVDGVFAPATAFSRARVQGVFARAVTGASDAPKGPAALALGHVLYLAHLGVLLWWLLDRSARQRTTTALVDVIGQLLPSVALALRLPSTRSFVVRFDALMREALFDDATA
jgi:AcrR family transcriptional regulator